jgi:hypothetical protein
VRLAQLQAAEGQLSALKEQAPGTTRSQRAALKQRLSHAEQQVAVAAEAARLASANLGTVLAERECVQAELAAVRQQLQAQPQHAELHAKLAVCAGLSAGAFVCVCVGGGV